MKGHKCYIGEWLDYENTELVTFEDLIGKVKSKNETYNYGLSTYGEQFMHGLMYELELKNYFDRRKNTNFNHFNYCPYCGEEINWKLLRLGANAK